MKNLTILFIFLILHCESEPIKKTKYKNEMIGIPKEKFGKLTLQIHKSDYSLKDFQLNLHLSNKKPMINGTETKWVFFSPIFIPLDFSKNPEIVGFKHSFHTYQEKIIFWLPEGMYYGIIESFINDEFGFDSIENKVIYMKFGFDFDLYKYPDLPILEYNSGCKNQVKRSNQTLLSYDNLNLCGKIKINENKETIINLSIGEKNLNLLSFIKIFPGLIFLSPFHNRPSYFYRREYQIELINPKEEHKESSSELQPKKVNDE
ncbi:MAG: hypothetical protein SFU98_01880 [Leptospiraceae bacterium]|nr:hypothetical protein [Leptospiraceae bacterium]